MAFSWKSTVTLISLETNIYDREYSACKDNLPFKKNVLMFKKNKQNIIWLVKLESEILVVTVSKGRAVSWWIQSNTIWK